jgi:hypothetical protein
MSDIFNEYARIMKAKGLLKEAAGESTTVDKRYSKEYADTIKALYNVDMEDVEDIIEKAHPNKVIIAPSYDKLNGLIENVNERHDVMVGITNKIPNGTLTNHKYAQTELLNELIRLGFDLDNQGFEKIAIMADDCAVKLADQENMIVKEAFAFLTPLLGIVSKFILPAVITEGISYAVKGGKGVRTVRKGTTSKVSGVVSGLGALSAILFIKNKVYGNISQGIKPDAERAIEALNDLKLEVSPAYRGELDKWIGILGYIRDNTKKAEMIAGNNEHQEILSSKNAIESTDVESSVKGTKEELEFLGEFRKMAEYVANKIGKDMGPVETGFINQISNMKLESDETSSSWWEMAKDLYGKVAGNEKDDAINAVAALRDSLNAFTHSFDQATDEAQSKSETEVDGIIGYIKSKFRDEDDGEVEVEKPSQEESDLNEYFKGV